MQFLEKMNVIIALPSFRAAKCKNSCISKNQAVEVVEVTELGIQNEEWEREEASAYAGAVFTTGVLVLYLAPGCIAHYLSSTAP